MLREKVRAILRRMPEVSSFGPAPEGFGGWGATVAGITPEHA